MREFEVTAWECITSLELDVRYHIQPVEGKVDVHLNLKHEDLEVHHCVDCHAWAR